MESAELTAFFNDCGLFPSQDEITEACESVGKVIHLFVFVSGIASITGVTLSQSFGQSHLYRNFYSASGVILVIRQSKNPYSSTVMYRKYLNQLRIERNKCQLTLRPFLILSATEWAELRLLYVASSVNRHLILVSFVLSYPATNSLLLHSSNIFIPCFFAVVHC